MKTPAALLLAFGLTVALGVVGFLAVIVGKSLLQREDARVTAEVASAIKQFSGARAQLLKDREPFQNRKLSDPISEALDRQRNAWPNYIQNIKNINVSHCPKDFRLACLDYQQALERADTSNFRMLIDLLSLAHLQTEGVSDEFKRGDAVVEARFNLEKLAVRYGVQLPAEK